MNGLCKKGKKPENDSLEAYCLVALQETARSETEENQRADQLPRTMHENKAKQITYSFSYLLSLKASP